MTATWNNRINAAGKVICAPDWEWDTAPGLPDYDLITILGGTGSYQVESMTFEARPGTCMLFRKGQRVIGKMDPSDPMTVIYIHFDYLNDANRMIIPTTQSLPNVFRILDQPQFFYGLLDHILDAGACPEESLVRDAWMKVVLLELLRQDSQPQWSGFQGEQAKAFKSLSARISQNPGFHWRIAGLAREFHCTPDHFGRLFVKYIGITPGEFIIRSRINAAIALLHSSSHSIARIAELLGYSDIFAFSRQFRQKTGVRPSACRKRT